MRILFIIALTFFVSTTFAQSNLVEKTFQRKGLVFGVGLGGGVLSLNTNDTLSSSFSTTIPNIKVGYMLNNRFALYVLLPGANYKYKGKSRGFEGILVSGQYWIKDHWWVLGGAGLTFDAAAFYTVNDPETAGFYTGLPAFTASSGYEVWHKGKFALDIQYRFFYGKSNLPNRGLRNGISNMVVIGFNWY